MKRSERRHHRKRVIRKFQRIYKAWDYENWELDGKTTAGRGSIHQGCICCSNPRRNGYDEPRTKAELKSIHYLKHWRNEHESFEKHQDSSTDGSSYEEA